MPSLTRNNNKFLAEARWLNPETMNVSNSKLSEFDLFFASSLELNVYRQLRKYLPKSSIQCQHKLQIKPGTKVYPPLYWRVDFAIKPSTDEPKCPIRFIEAKGFALEVFKRNLQYLQLFDEYSYNRLLVVGEKAKPIDKTINQITIKEMMIHIREQMM